MDVYDGVFSTAYDFVYFGEVPVIAVGGLKVSRVQALRFGGGVSLDVQGLSVDGVRGGDKLSVDGVRS